MGIERWNKVISPSVKTDRIFGCLTRPDWVADLFNGHERIQWAIGNFE